MKLKALKVKNFRGFKGEVSVSFDNLTALVGRNDVGKSSVMEALAIFFESSVVKFEAADRCINATDNVVRIGCVFSDVPRQIVIDTSATTSLASEHMLTVEGDLEVHRVYQFDQDRFKEAIVAVANHPTASGCQDLLLKKNSELKGLFISLGATLLV